MFRAAHTGDLIELNDDDARSLVTIAPERGSIVTRFRVGDQDLLFMDESTLTDPTKNVRGGIPLLFPSPGRLTGDRFERAGQSGAMKQHGFARDVAWKVDRCPRAMPRGHPGHRVHRRDAGHVSLGLPPGRDVRAARTRLRLDATVDDTGTQPMPFAFGIHPYFLVHDKAAATIATKATRAFDNVTKNAVPSTAST